MNKTQQIKYLVSAAMLLASKKACNEPSFIKWWEIVKACHKVGYLYVATEGNAVATALIAYRIPELKEDSGYDIPLKESGKTLFIQACASQGSDKFKLVKLMNWYRKANRGVTRFAYRRRGGNKIIVRHL